MPFGLSIPDPGNIIRAAFGSGDESTVHAPPVTITERGGERRKIVLRDRALPFRPVTWGGRHRTRLTWYQGNPVATQQVLGPEEDPTTFSGSWKNRFIKGSILVNGSADSITTAERAVRLFSDIRRGGAELDVAWGLEVRRGVLVAFSADWLRAEDCNWSMEFEWNSRDGDDTNLANAIPTRGKSDLLSALNQIEDALVFAEDFTRAMNAQLVTTVESVRASVTVILGALRTIEAAASIPASVLGAIQSASASIRLETTEEIARLRDVTLTGGPFPEDGLGLSAEPRRRRGGPVVAVAMRPEPLLKAESGRRNIADALAGLREVALVIEDQTVQKATPDQVQQITMPDEMSLYTVSSRFYGTPDFASFLARVNGLSSAIVPAGFSLKIPPRPTVGTNVAAGDC